LIFSRIKVQVILKIWVLKSTISITSIILLYQIYLICNEPYNHIFIWEFSYFLQPVPKINKWLDIAYIIYKKSSNCKSVVSCSDAQKLFSAWSIPNLSSYFLVAVRQWKSFEFKFNPVGCLWLRFVIVSRNSH